MFMNAFIFDIRKKNCLLGSSRLRPPNVLASGYFGLVLCDWLTSQAFDRSESRLAVLCICVTRARTLAPCGGVSLLARRGTLPSFPSSSKMSPLKSEKVEQRSGSSSHRTEPDLTE